MEDRKDLQSFSKHFKTAIIQVTMRSVSGLAILSLNPSLEMKLTDDYAAGNTDAHKSPVDERYRLNDSYVLGGETVSETHQCRPDEHVMLMTWVSRGATRAERGSGAVATGSCQPRDQDQNQTVEQKRGHKRRGIAETKILEQEFECPKCYG